MTSIVRPGSFIGIFGGGQLGRMMAMAAHSLGYHINVMDPDPACPARVLANTWIEGSWDSVSKAIALASCSDVLTFEIEKVSRESLSAVSACTIRPSSLIMGIVQDRVRQKAWLLQHGLPIGAFKAVSSLQGLQLATESLGPDIFLKSASGGYDGRNQVRIAEPSAKVLCSAWEALGGGPCIAEQALTLQSEMSVMVARSPSGQTSVYPSARNYHHNKVLTWSVLPAAMSPMLERAARKLALQIAESLKLEGCLAVEMFVTEDGALLVNELAPRPHNSYHASERACETSQFEQIIRAICNLPLGSVEIVKPTAVVNLFGDLWMEGLPCFERALSISEVRLHLYGKSKPSKGRKMGHLSATGNTSEEALERVMAAFNAIFK